MVIKFLKVLCTGLHVFLIFIKKKSLIFTPKTPYLASSTMKISNISYMKNIALINKINKIIKENNKEKEEEEDNEEDNEDNEIYENEEDKKCMDKSKR
jgi:hypothetical protein